MAITKIQSESLNLSDNYDFTGTVTGAGGVNTPAFEAWQSSNTGYLANNTYVKVQCNTEVFDVGSAYDSTTNYRFTPQTARKYFIYGNIRGNANGDTRLRNMYAALYINGSLYRESRINFNGERIRETSVFVSAMYSFNGSSDYVELYGAVDDASGSNQGYFTGDSTEKTTNFGAYKIIE